MNIPNRIELQVLGGNEPTCCEPGYCSTDAPSKGSVHVGSKQRRVDVELQYLDVSVCTKCQDTKKSLEGTQPALAPLMDTL